MPPTQRTLTLSVMDGLFAIAKLAPDAAIPGWATQGGFFSVTRTEDEVSLVVAEASVPDGSDASRGWRMFQLQGPFAFNEVGVLASVTNPLARIGIGIFVVSTFNTDYLLVQQDEAPAAVEALEHAGHRILRLELLIS
jgi:uncharacterized protein